MGVFWFILAAFFVVMFLFNGNIPAKPTVKVAVNVLAIVGVFILTLFAAGVV